ncbi:MAG: hypothetical protein ICV69_02455 [Thermoleophilaceae bacterium]|nr:hypothetical protein [Thermoleophilaceae bacterium]
MRCTTVSDSARDPSSHARGVVARRPDPLVGERLGERREQERVPRGRLVAGADELLVRRLTARALDQRAERPGGERSRGETRCLGIPRQSPQQPRPSVGRPRANHEDQRQLADPSREVGEEAQGGLVGPLHVVNGDERGSLVCYAQQVFTRLVDNRGHDLVNDVAGHGPAGAREMKTH